MKALFDLDNWIIIMLAIWSTYNESNYCIYRIEDNDYLQLSHTWDMGLSLQFRII